MEADDKVLESLSKEVKERLDLSEPTQAASFASLSNRNPNILMCDAGYGLPREGRPRKEKILAIARQLVNFLQWQQQAGSDHVWARVEVVACPDEPTKDALKQRTLGLLSTKILPSHVTFSCQPLEEAASEAVRERIIPEQTQGSEEQAAAVYLSPDAPETLNPSSKPPRVVVVGLLIDRRVQPNRSKDRAGNLELVAKRWALDECFSGIAANEPLNVDCILEGMQQWWWNQENQKPLDPQTAKETFVQAATQAIEHHARRHPSRPVHLSKGS